MASSSFPSSSSSTHLFEFDDGAAKSDVAVAESEPQYYNFILPSTDEEAIPPITPPLTHDDKGKKRKVNEFFYALATDSEGKQPDDEIAPADESGFSTHLSPHFPWQSTINPTRNMALSSSTHISHPHQYDKAKGKMPKLFDAFTSEEKPAATDEILPTEAGRVAMDLSLDFAWPPPIKTKNEVGNMALSSSCTDHHLSDDAAKSHVAVAKTQLQYYSFVTDEKAIPHPITPPLTHDNKGKRKVNGFFNYEIAPTEAGVSTDLSLHFPGPPTNLPDDDGWKIKKVLTPSDVDGSSRLRLPKVDVQKHILPHVMGGGRELEEGQGVEVGVRDVDEGSEHVLVLKKWKGGSNVLVKNWMSDFVKRRKLEEKDEIGLRWDDENSKLEFTVLRKK